jgi:Cu/Ag efflux pump CusA
LIKSVLEFGLTRSAIIVLGLVVFCTAGLVAFTKLNIEACPNPAPVILEITAQAAGHRDRVVFLHLFGGETACRFRSAAG